MRCLVSLFAILALLFTASPLHAQSRSASFVNPATSGPAREGGDGKGGKGTSQLPVSVMADPAQVDAGETLVNVARRITVFFYNGFRAPVQISDLTLNADGNVRSKVVTNDCLTLKTLPVSDRCSVAVEVVPSSPGPWSVELLLSHSGQGRIARAEVLGSTLGKADGKAEGLAISKKIAAPLEFGEVRAGEEKAARTMLIENDSPEELVISAIDLVTQDDNGLALRKEGCKVDDKLKPGESCPITLIWSPQNYGKLATDLIVRHSGNLGFVVVPIRGSSATLQGEKSKDGKDETGGNRASLIPRGAEKNLSLGDLPPPSMKELANALPQIRMEPRKAEGGSDNNKNAAKILPPASSVALNLIGTVGGRAILGGGNIDTTIIGLGETADIGGAKVELLQLDAMRAVVNIDGMRKELALRSASSYMQKSAGDDKIKSGAASETAKSNSQTTPPAPPPANTPPAANNPPSADNAPPQNNNPPGSAQLAPGQQQIVLPN